MMSRAAVRSAGIERGKPTRESFVEYRRTHDPRLRDELVNQHLGLADRAAYRFSGRGEDHDDLRQVASIALVKAVENFDPARGWAFSTYATPTIVGALKHHLRDRCWAVRPPRALQERCLHVAAATEHVTAQLRDAPTIADVAAHGGWTEAEVREALGALGQRRHVSLDVDDEEEGLPEPGNLDPNLLDVEPRALVASLLDALDRRERAIVTMRVFDGLAQREIGRRIGLSQMHVSRLLARSMQRLREAALLQGEYGEVATG
jgi:RNA polymerase sigma-B factor